MLAERAIGDQVGVLFERRQIVFDFLAQPRLIGLLFERTKQGMGFELMYKANLKVLKTADELTQAALDLKA